MRRSATCSCKGASSAVACEASHAGYGYTQLLIHDEPAVAEKHRTVWVMPNVPAILLLSSGARYSDCADDLSLCHSDSDLARIHVASLQTRAHLPLVMSGNERRANEHG